MAASSLANGLALTSRAAAAPPSSAQFAPITSRDGLKNAFDNLARRLCDFGEFIRRMRTYARFGELSRAPLRLLRLELQGDRAECEWIARPADPWDAALPPGTAERNASRQALKDAIAVRELLFRTLPDLESAVIRIYRQASRANRELIVAGTVSREQFALGAVRSDAMRAKLFGLRFWLNDGILESLDLKQDAVNS